jgi:hypothetical protein
MVLFLPDHNLLDQICLGGNVLSQEAIFFEAA